MLWLKLVIEIPSKFLIQINQLPLQIESCKFHDQMNHFRFIEIPFMLFNILDLYCSLRQIDEPTRFINCDYLHAVLSADSQQFLNVLYSLSGDTGGQDQGLSIIIFQEFDVSSIFIHVFYFNLFKYAFSVFICVLTITRSLISGHSFLQNLHCKFTFPKLSSLQSS